MLGASVKGVKIDAGHTRDFGPQAVVVVQGAGKQPDLNKPVVLSPEGRKVQPEAEKSFLQKYVQGSLGVLLSGRVVVRAIANVYVQILVGFGYRSCDGYERWWKRVEYGFIIASVVLIPLIICYIPLSLVCMYAQSESGERRVCVGVTLSRVWLFVVDLALTKQSVPQYSRVSLKMPLLYAYQLRNHE